MRMLLVIATLLMSYAVRSSRAHCPGGWYVNGASGGYYECRSAYSLPDDCTLGGTHCVEREDPSQLSYVGWIYCTNGWKTVQDGRSVWCQRP